MKNLFTVQRKSEQVDENGYILCPATAFVEKRAETELAEKQRQARAELTRLNKAAALPLWARVVGIVLFVAFCVFLLIFCAEWGDSTISEVHSKMPWLLPCLGGSVVFEAAFLVAAHFRKQRVSSSSEAAQIIQRTEKLAEESYLALGVPEDAQDVDIMIAVLGKKQAEKQKLRMRPVYHNQNARLYREGEAVCFGFIGCVVKIPLERVTAIRQVDKWLCFRNWNKTENCRKGIYKQYKIRPNNNNGTISVKPYYAVEVQSGTEEFEIIVPCYDIEPLLRATGKTVY